MSDWGGDGYRGDGDGSTFTGLTDWTRSNPENPTQNPTQSTQSPVVWRELLGLKRERSRVNVLV